MDPAERARWLASLDEMLELVEAHIDRDEARWIERVTEMSQRRDGSLERVLHQLSRYAALLTQGLSEINEQSKEQAMTEARLALMQWI